MGKYSIIFSGITAISLIIYIIFSEAVFYVSGGHILEGPLLAVGTIITLLLAFLIAQIQYLIDLIQKSRQ